MGIRATDAVAIYVVATSGAVGESGQRNGKDEVYESGGRTTPCCSRGLNSLRLIEIGEYFTELNTEFPIYGRLEEGFLLFVGWFWIIDYNE